MSATWDMVAKVSIDASDAKKGVEEVEKGVDKIGQELDKTAKKAKRSGESLKNLGKKGAAGAKKAAAAVLKLGTAAAGAAVGAGAALVKIGESFTALQNKVKTAKLFGGTEENAKALKRALDETITSSEALVLSSELFSAGFDTSKAQTQAALLAKAFKAANGGSIEAQLEMMKSGEVSGRLASKFKFLNDTIRGNIAAWEASNKVEATADEKMKILVSTITKAGGKVGAFVKELNKANKASAFDQLMASFRELRDEIIKKIGPAVKAFVKDFKDGLPEMKKKLVELGKNFRKSEFFKVMVEAFELLKKIIKMSKAFSAQKTMKEQMKEGARADLLLMGKTGDPKSLEAQRRKEELESIKKNQAIAIMARSVDFQNKQTTEAKKRKEEKKTTGVIVKEGRKRLSLRKRIAALIKTEAAEETKALQGEARAQTRNFASTLSDAVGAMGGSFSGILTSQKDFFEQARITSSWYKKRVTEASKLTFEQITTTKTLRNEEERRAAFLLKTKAEAGALDARERLLIEKNVNEQLRAGLSSNAAIAELAAARVEGRVAEIDLANSIKAIDTFILGLQLKKNKANARIIGILQKYKREIKGEAEERQRILKIQAKQAKAQIKLNDLLKAQEYKKSLVDANRALEDINTSLLAIKAPAQAALLQTAQGFKRGLEDAEAALVTMQANLERLQAKPQGLEALIGSPMEALRNIQAVKNMEERIRLQKLLIEGIAAQSEEQARLNSFTGQFQQLWRSDVVLLPAKAAQVTKESMEGMLGIISSSVENMITGTIGEAGAAAGKMFLDVLAGAAAKMGAYFIAVGAAQQFVPPYTGAGAIAGGIALMALSGALKGAGSLVGASATPTPSTGGSVSGKEPTFQPSSLPGQRTPAGSAPVNFYFSVNQEPWNQKSDQERFASLRRWSERMGRSTGIADPFQLAQGIGRGRR